MKTKQVNPMPALIGSGFDCEFKDSHNTVYGSTYFYHIGLLLSVDETYGDFTSYVMDGYQFVDTHNCRPRLNKPQVLPDWGWLDNPLLDGFVWEVRWFNDIAEMLYTDTVDSKKCFEIATHPLHDFLHAEIKGVQKGSQLEDWAIENDVPVYNDDMEVVK